MGQPSDGSSAAAPLPAPGLSRKGWLAVLAVVLFANVPLLHRFLLRPRPEATASIPYSDDFSDPATVAKNYSSTGGLWRVVNGELLSPGVKNNPLWLKAKLPRDVAVEFDIRSDSAEGDLKCEIFGDGSDHGSGYVLIHGGWNNKLSIIARLYEHGESLETLQQKARQKAAEKKLPSNDVVSTGVFKADTQMRVEANPFPVQAGRTYHWRIERRGGELKWFVDGQLFMQLADPFPLEGPDHDRFGFSSWESQLYFDNLHIQPL